MCNWEQDMKRCCYMILILIGCIILLWPETSAYDEYDITINTDWTYLRALGEEGWKVKLSNNLIKPCKYLRPNNKSQSDDEYKKCIKSVAAIEGTYVSWTGGFNKGKTTILNYVTGKTYPTGYDKEGETRGFNFIRLEPSMEEAKKVNLLPGSAKRSSIILIDTPGVTRCVKPDELQDRFLTDRFVYDILPDLSHVVVFVVGILTSHEQVTISQLMDKLILYSAQENDMKKLFIVHNFKTLESVANVIEYIKTDIIEAFVNVQKDLNRNFYTSQYKNRYQIVHFIFAKEGSEAGNYFNNNTVKYLRNILFHNTIWDKTSVKVLDHFMYKLTPLLRDYFHPHTYSAKDIVDPPPSIYDRFINFFAYQSEPGQPHVFLVRDNNQDAVDDQCINNDPYRLVFETAKKNDGSHGVITLNKKGTLYPCNSASVGDIPECRPSPKCAIWQTDKIWGISCQVGGAEFVVADKKTFEKEMKSKIAVLKLEDACDLIIQGTIRPPWSKFVTSDDEKNNFDLIHTDGMMHGWIKKKFTMPRLVCDRYQNHHKIHHQHGSLIIVITKRN